MRVSTCSSKGSTPAPWIFTENDVTSSRRILTASLPVTLFASVLRNQRNRFNRIIKSSAKAAEHVSFQNSWDSVDMPIKQSETPANHLIIISDCKHFEGQQKVASSLDDLHICEGTIYVEVFYSLFQGRPCFLQRETIFLHPFEQHVRKSLQSEPATHWNIWHMIKRKIWQRRPWTVEQQEWRKKTTKNKNLSAADGPLSSQTLAGLLRRSGHMQHVGKGARLLWNGLLEVYAKNKRLQLLSCNIWHVLAVLLANHCLPFVFYLPWWGRDSIWATFTILSCLVATFKTESNNKGIVIIYHLLPTNFL